jgi:hypothetical protein
MPISDYDVLLLKYSETNSNMTVKDYAYLLCQMKIRNIVKYSYLIHLVKEYYRRKYNSFV